MQNIVGPNIKTRLKQLKKTQDWLAEQAGVSSTAVSKWIAFGQISLEKLIDIAKILSISLDDLMNPDGFSTPEKAPPTLALVYIDHEELQLITAFRESTEMGKALISTAAHAAPRSTNLTTTNATNKS